VREEKSKGKDRKASNVLRGFLSVKLYEPEILVSSTTVDLMFLWNYAPDLQSLLRIYMRSLVASQLPDRTSLINQKIAHVGLPRSSPDLTPAGRSILQLIVLPRIGIIVVIVVPKQFLQL
jgi:hypothetical protein